MKQEDLARVQTDAQAALELRKKFTSAFVDHDGEHAHIKGASGPLTNRKTPRGLSGGSIRNKAALLRLFMGCQCSKAKRRAAVAGLPRPAYALRQGHPKAVGSAGAPLHPLQLCPRRQNQGPPLSPAAAQDAKKRMGQPIPLRPQKFLTFERTRQRDIPIAALPPFP